MRCYSCKKKVKYLFRNKEPGKKPNFVCEKCLPGGVPKAEKSVEEIIKEIAANSHDK